MPAPCVSPRTSEQTCDRRHGTHGAEAIASVPLIAEQTMHLRIRFIGRALEYLNDKGYDDRCLSLQVSPELLHVGDLIRHPLFPGRSVYVVAREIDLVDRCVSVWVDELPYSVGAGARPDDTQRDLRVTAAEGNSAFTAGTRVIGG